ncbi:hypothetical protein [Acrocarpospora catenulata]|uniref:hypothetical protein n=1 Tax=Acrocarpospora catenulata TaxID=2836182 RepID=UPI001BD9698E|nr:hypothetical protein [Acrocarpospora catenulata]
MRDHVVLPSGWVRPWFPAGVSVRESTFDRGCVIEGHLFDDCEVLLRRVSEPVEGCGWLDPRQPGTCEDCIERFDEALASELFHDEDCDCSPCEQRAKGRTAAGSEQK